jgi:hypothetical protein
VAQVPRINIVGFQETHYGVCTQRSTGSLVGY